MMFFYNGENDCYESIEIIRNDYFLCFENDYKTFQEYLKNCMYSNNGALESLETREKYLKKLLSTIDDDDVETIRAYMYELETVRALRAQEKTGEFAIINFTFNGKYKIVERSGKTLYEYSGTGFDDIPFDVVLREIIRIEFDNGIIITVE